MESSIKLLVFGRDIPVMATILMLMLSRKAYSSVLAIVATKTIE